MTTSYPIHINDGMAGLLERRRPVKAAVSI